MTSDARPEEVMALFGADAHPTGLMHGTVTLVRGGFAVEHTTECCDGAYRDSRHPESVRFTGSIEEDLARRDFTVNAIALSPEGTLVDPFGGREDLRSGVLRCVGDPARRFAEDALRILRLLRFASVLGFSVEENTTRAARERRDGLRAIAHERVYAELNKLLCGEHAAAVLLEYPDILGVVLPEILPCVGFDQRNPHHCYDVWEHTARTVGAVPPTRVLRWTMLLHDLGKPKMLYTGCERHRTLLRTHRRFRGNGGGDHGAAALRARARAGRAGAAGLLRRDVSARARGGAPHDGTLWARDDVEPFADQARGQRR